MTRRSRRPVGRLRARFGFGGFLHSVDGSIVVVLNVRVLGRDLDGDKASLLSARGSV